MNFKEFVNERGSVRTRIEQIRRDPIKQILEQDGLPCDGVASVDGTLQKVVYITDEEYVPVVELLSYYPEEMSKVADSDFKSAYFAYMDNVDVENSTIESVMSASKEYIEKKRKQERLLQKCTQ